MEYTQEIIEKHGKVNQETGELEVDRTSLKREYVNRGVYVLKEIDILKGDLRSLLEDSKELHGFNKSELGKLVKYVHKNSIDDEIADLEDIQSQITNLFPEECDDE